MRIPLRPFLDELAWIGGIFILTLTIGFFAFNRNPLTSDSMDVYVYDTYFVFSGASWVTTIFVWLLVVTYLIKEGIRKYNRWLPDMLLSLWLIILIVMLLNWHSILLGVGSTIFPPLSALPVLAQQGQNTFEAASKAIIGMEVVLVVGVWLLGIKIGKLIPKADKN